MAKKISTALFVFFVLQCGFCSHVFAQCGGGALKVTTWWTPDPIPTGWFYYAPYPGTFVYLIASYTAGCPPIAWCPTCQAPAGAPISLTNGNTYIQESDVKIPGLGGGLTLGRTWNSIWPSFAGSATGLFGPNWRSTYEENLTTGSDGYLRYVKNDGTVWVFGTSNGTTASVVSPASVVATLTQSGSQPWTITFQNGEQRVFDFNSMLLTTIVDRNGNTTQLSYDSANRLTTVTDPASRHLTFSYANNTSRLVTSVSSDVGSLTVCYTYDTQGRLSQVTEQDQSTITFTYNSQSLITAVTDSQGKLLESHTYDTKGRGLTSARANGVEAVTVSYPNE
jgi:YD repeat-containing protein